jgi:hypothetical protein
MSTDPQLDLDALVDRLVGEYADRVASGRGGELDDLVAQVPAERRADVRRLLGLIDVGAAGEGSAAHAPKLLGPGVELGGCRILGELGRGGVATVYRAEQQGLAREVALKVLRPGLALEPKHAARFRREGLAIARLDHPNIVKVFDVGAEAGHLFLVMEKVEGGSLAQALASGSFPRDERSVAAFFAVVARAVAAAHARGVVHRDLKPSNILLRRDGTPVVADFGLAKGEGDLAFTLTGEPLGTPYYMSPEQVEQAANRTDARTDVYSLGVTLYEVLAGRRPFEGTTTMAVFDAIRSEHARPLRSVVPELSPSIEAIVAKAMARDPADRYATAEALALDLEELVAGRPTLARMPKRRKLLVGVMVGLGRGSRREYEYRSATSLLGLPLVHVNLSVLQVRGSIVLRSGEPRRVARGWLAIGDRAIGVLAFGQQAFGLVAMGGLAGGGVAIGGCALGVVGVGGVAAGLLAIGGVALGLVAIGGVAVGALTAGGLSIGRPLTSLRDAIAHWRG